MVDNNILNNGFITDYKSADWKEEVEEGEGREK